MRKSLLENKIQTVWTICWFPTWVLTYGKIILSILENYQMSMITWWCKCQTTNDTSKIQILNLCRIRCMFLIYMYFDVFLTSFVMSYYFSLHFIVYSMHCTYLWHFNAMKNSSGLWHLKKFGYWNFPVFSISLKYMVTTKCNRAICLQIQHVQIAQMAVFENIYSDTLLYVVTRSQTGTVIFHKVLFYFCSAWVIWDDSSSH